MAAQALALREDEEEAGTGRWDSEEEKYVDEDEEAEEPGLDRPECGIYSISLVSPSAPS